MFERVKNSCVHAAVRMMSLKQNGEISDII